MKILVNDKNIDFTLENEKKLGDVIRDLEKWITQNDNVIRSVKINNKELDLEEFNNENAMNIEDINTIEIVTSNKIELAFDTLRTINEYINSILKIFNNSTIDEIIKKNDAVLEGIELILEGLKLSLKILHINPAVIANDKKETLDDLLIKLTEIKNEYERKYLDDNAIDLLKNILSNLESYIIKIYKWGVVKSFGRVKTESGEFSDFNKDIPFINEIIEDLLVVCKNAEIKFEEIGTNIQVGEDLQAFNGIYYLSGIINEIIEVFKIIEKIVLNNNNDILRNLETNIVFEAITDNLKEVEESFHNEDLITIADVMEYELKPNFVKLLDIISKINNFIKII